MYQRKLLLFLHMLGSIAPLMPMVLERVLIGHDGPVRCIAISPDETCIASGSDDKTVKVWSLEDSTQEVKTFHGHTGPVTNLVFNCNGAQLRSFAADNTAYRWTVATGEHPPHITLPSGTMYGTWNRKGKLARVYRDGAEKYIIDVLNVYGCVEQRLETNSAHLLPRTLKWHPRCKRFAVIDSNDGVHDFSLGPRFKDMYGGDYVDLSCHRLAAALAWKRTSATDEPVTLYYVDNTPQAQAGPEVLNFEWCSDGKIIEIRDDGVHLVDPTTGHRESLSNQQALCLAVGKNRVAFSQGNIIHVLRPKRMRRPRKLSPSIEMIE